ncbi:hypothetical protein GCM10023165_00920 [Variovorax defluvii]|uniref:Toxin CptA n=1 Tax=Variovorax defluvii TaxID=913761 RepID=A0ABP8GR89_9BURK
MSYPVGRSRLASRLLLVLWASGACCALAASVRSDGVDWRSGLLVFGIFLAGLAVRTSSLRRESAAMLHFDGARWSIPGTTGPQAAAAKVALDVQSSLLVRLTFSDGACRWLWLDRHAAPERWQALRRAVYSRPAPAGHSPALAQTATVAGSRSLLS